MNLLRSQLSVDWQSGFKKICFVSASVCTCPFPVKCAEEFPARKKLSTMTAEQKNGFMESRTAAYRIQISGVNGADAPLSFQTVPPAWFLVEAQSVSPQQ